ncbi:MAG: hypothetical protein H8D26_04715 [Methanomicrobia archaeon]|nr:hypothetical protein [Methanomicrobia archaeon]
MRSDTEILTQRERWLLAGEYKILKELPSVEAGLEKEMIEDLKVQRILAHQNFRGIIADKPVDTVRMLPDTSFRTQQRNLYIELPNAFNLTEDNTPFTPNEMPLQKHLSNSRVELIKQGNALYEKREKERKA